MPAIREYTSEQTTFRPSDAGAETIARGARQVGALAREGAAETERAGSAIAGGVKAVGNAAVDYMTNKEISAGSPRLANLTDTLTNGWNDIASKADPNDPTVAQQFREKVLEPALDKYRDGFATEGGQKWAEAHVESLRNHMFEKTSADMSSLAAQAVKVNMVQTSNSLSNTAMNDPTAVPHLLDTVDGMVGGIISSAPNIKGAAAANARLSLTQDMKEKIVHAGAQGAITKADDPEAEAKKWGDQYPDYISGGDLKSLTANARSEIRARNYDFETNRRREKEITQDKSTAAFNDYYIQVRNADPKLANDPTSQKILHDPNLTKPDKGALMRLVDRELKPETDARISAQTSVQLFRMAADPNSDPGKVRQAIIDARSKDPGTPGSITKADYDDNMRNLSDLKTPEGMALTSDRNEFIKRYSIVIGGADYGQGFKTEKGEVALYQLEKDARRQEALLKSKGQDPHSLYDPASPNFIGKPANLQKYQVSMQDNLQGGKPNPSPLGDNITGVETTNLPTFKPPGDWQYSKTRNQYRDAQGRIYGIDGKPVKQ